MTPPQATTWPPSPEQIEVWLGGYTEAMWQRTEVVPAGGRRQWAAMRDGLMGMGFTVVAAAAYIGTGLGRYLILAVLCAVAGLATLVGAFRPERVAVDGTDVTVSADGAGLTVRISQLAQETPWTRLVAVEDHGTGMVLRLRDDEVLRLPDDSVFWPVVATARRVVAARAAHNEALQARMARGLSRPAGDATAERGLSVTD